MLPVAPVGCVGCVLRLQSPVNKTNGLQLTKQTVTML